MSKCDLVACIFAACILLPAQVQKLVEESASLRIESVEVAGKSQAPGRYVSIAQSH